MKELFILSCLGLSALFLIQLRKVFKSPEERLRSIEINPEELF